jgi:UDP-N-acetylmuramoyl-L-alanyl-D-glutamate--2,6-diaminopimelate ligase
MKIKKLFAAIPNVRIIGSKEVEITNLCNDSKRAYPGSLFIAKRGRKFDGALFIPEAISNGSVAILTDLQDPFLDKKIVQIIHPDVSLLESEIAASYYGFPAQELFLVGVTGTSGKTTSCYLIRHLLEKLGISSGMIGTVEIIAKKISYPSSMTTFDALSNQKLLREMVKGGNKGCVMEVSSHGLDQGRVSHLDFNIALFTNISHEHLDYHKTWDHYFASKQKLFTSLKPTKNGRKNFALLNADSSYCERMKEGCLAEVITYGIDQRADLRASDIVMGVNATQMALSYKEQREVFSLPLIGKYNVSNLLGAVSVGLTLGASLREMKDLFSLFPQVPGRLERVIQKAPFSVYVDYAHKEDALRQVLLCLRQIAKKRILTLFGCGGDRDWEKRPRMAKIAQEFSDFVVVTSDNPRSEDPQKIVDEILPGFSSDRYLVELDRRLAIEKILRMAQKDDLVLIAGKGHETTQIFAHKRQEFDDRKVAKEVCDAL